MTNKQYTKREKLKSFIILFIVGPVGSGLSFYLLILLFEKYLIKYIIII